MATRCGGAAPSEAAPPRLTAVPGRIPGPGRWHRRCTTSSGTEEAVTVMDGYVLGWIVTCVVFVGLAVVFVLAAWSMPRATEGYTAEMFCPWRRRCVTVQLATDGEVISCTAFADRQTVTCGAPCVGGKHRLLMNAERPVELV